MGAELRPGAAGIHPVVAQWLTLFRGTAGAALGIKASRFQPDVLFGSAFCCTAFFAGLGDRTGVPFPFVARSKYIYGAAIKADPGGGTGGFLPVVLYHSLG